MRKTLTVRLAKTTRSDLVCLVCGGFRTELAVLFGMCAFVEDAVVGIHKGCLKSPHRAKVERVDVVSKTGEVLGTFPTLGEAVAAVDRGQQRTIILGPGVYNEDGVVLPPTVTVVPP